VVVLWCGASSSFFFFADASNFRLVAPPGLVRLKLKDMGLEVLSCPTSFNFYLIGVSLRHILALLRNSTEAGNLLSGNRRLSHIHPERGKRGWSVCMQGRYKTLNPSALFKGNVFPHVRDVGFFAEHNVQQFLDQGTHTGCTLGAHCDGGLKEMEPATLIPSHSHSFKSESRLR
jgi:hypothetical protein